MAFTKQNYMDFKLEYMKAVRQKKEQFTFRGQEFLTSFAKYLLEYLSSKFEKSY